MFGEVKNSDENKVEIESGMFNYLHKMHRAFDKVELDLFPIAEPRIETRICEYCGESYVWSSLYEEVSKHSKQIDEAGAISVRQINRILAAACSSALEEKTIVSCMKVRDRVIQCLSQVPNNDLATGYKQFLQRDPAEVLAS